MAKANWLNVSQSSGTGDASIDVSLPPHTGRKKRSSVITFRAANLSDVQCSVNQDGKTAFIDIESEIAINENGEEATIEGTSNSARLTFYLGDGNLSNISLPETYMVNSIKEKNGNVISGDPGASAEYNFAIAITVPANDDTTVKTREVVVEDEMGNKGVCVLSLAAQKKPYTEVEYIESTGTQWINTGVNIDTSTDEVELVIQGLTTTVYKWFFGEHDDGARFGLGSGDGSNKRNVAYGKTTYKVNDTQIYNSKHTFIANKDGVFLDGVKITNHASFTSSSTIYLFNLNISNQSSYTSSARIWSYKQTRNGQEFINLIPVLDNNGVACMYDNVSGRFFYNSGTGQFVAGDIV